MRRFILLAEQYSEDNMLLEGRIEFLEKQYLPLITQFITTPVFKEQNQPIPQLMNRNGFDPAKVFAFILAVDPDRSKKNVQWVLKQFITGKLRLEDMEKATSSLLVFERVKRIMPVEERDINRYPDLDTFMDTMDVYSKQMSKAEADRNYVVQMEKQADIIFNNAEYKIVIPKTQEASNFYGINTRWCTTSSRGSQFESYTRKGPLYIILDKANNKRWQFHFVNGQFMDEMDRSIGKFIDKDKLVFVDSMSLSDFVEQYGNETAKDAAKYVFGEDRVEQYNESPDSDVKETLIDSLKENQKKELVKYLVSNYSSEIEELGIEVINDDMSTSEILELQDEVDDGELSAAFYNAYNTGYEYGTEKAMYDAMMSALKSCSCLYYRRPDSDEITSEMAYMDDLAVLAFPIPLILKHIESDIDTIELGTMMEEGDDKVHIDDPRYGWSDYDEDAALDRFIDDFPRLS